MGVSQNTHIGPYIKVEEKIVEKEVSETLNTCSNTECEIHGKKSVGKFCSNCGSENKPTTTKNKKNVILSIYELLHEFGDSDLVFPVEVTSGSKILLPNRRNKYSISIDRDTESKEKEIGNIDQKVESFKDDYNELIQFLKRKELSFDIKFGVISYWY